MRIIKTSAVFAALFLIFAASADAQRTTRRTTTPKVTTTTTTAAGSAAEMKAGAEKPSNQLINTTRFLYILGSAAKGIEDLDKDTRANRAAKDANETNKRELRQAMAGLTAGLRTLEVEFRTKPALRRAVTQIEGIAILSEDAERLAASGKYYDAGKPLLQVIEKLSNTLVALR